MAPFSLSTTNLSYYTVPAAFLLAFIPHGVSVVLAGKNMNYAEPRKTIDNCERDTTMEKRAAARVARAKAASANGFESLGYYAAAVVAANVARVPTDEVNTLALVYVLSRAAYNVAYVVLQENKRMYPVRTAVWTVGVGLVSWLFVRAGQVMNA